MTGDHVSRIETYYWLSTAPYSTVFMVTTTANKSAMLSVLDVIVTTTTTTANKSFMLSVLGS